MRDYVIIDAPGHREFLKNMISGAAGCDAALVVIDAVEGVREQSRRHGYLLHLRYYWSCAYGNYSCCRPYRLGSAPPRLGNY